MPRSRPVKQGTYVFDGWDGSRSIWKQTRTDTVKPYKLIKEWPQSCVFKVTTVEQPDLPDFFSFYLKASVWVIEVVMARSNGAICLKWLLKILDCGLHFLFSVNGDQLQNKDRLLSSSSLAPYKCSNKNGWLNSQMRCRWRAICLYWRQPRNKSTCIITIYCLRCQRLLKMGFSGTCR